MAPSWGCDYQCRNSKPYAYGKSNDFVITQSCSGCGVADVVGSLDEMLTVCGAEDASGLCLVDVKDDEEVDCEEPLLVDPEA